MKKFFIFLLLTLFFASNISAQFTKYIVRFKDKTGSSFSIDRPAEFLSAKSIERRTRQHISIDETDLPVLSRYVDSVRLAGNVTILNQSKWLNEVCIATTDAAALAKINSFSFVINSQPVKRTVNRDVISKPKFISEIKGITGIQSPMNPSDYYSYGNSYGQIHIHEGEYLHNKGFRGEGMQIAIIDAGFYHYQTLPEFDSARLTSLIMETYDFVNNEQSVNEDNAHGMQCFSIIAANMPGQFVGSSPNSKFYLYRSEDVSSESPVEEQYWIAAAERADSIGVDVISTSLGYTQFDNPAFNYTYADMNGHTTPIAKAAMLAAKKGMILLVAAGNDGDDPWHYIGTPADADSILSVGAIDISGNPAGFSSYGPASDGRIKPTVASVGVATTISSTDGSIVSGNGTSFATPNLAGLVTCLWQAFPEFTNMEIIEAVKKSSSIYNAPDDRIGYGIPNFRSAFDNLTQQRTLKNINSILGTSQMEVYPNPFKDNFTVLIRPENTATGTFRFYDISGKFYFSKQVSLSAGQPQVIEFNNIQTLQRGIYILRFSDGKKKESFKLLLQ
ncbi:MAG TPA: S8 family serine peptidase [Hanamia sp.]|nr:S8 family serine peptidase [Hanamia sp.]